MVTKVERLKRRSDFLRVAALRRKWAAPGLILQAAPCPTVSAIDTPPAGGAFVGASAARTSGPSLRVGFTCSKKVGNAVARNRARRRLRAAVAAVMPELAASGLDYVVIGRQETLRRPFDQLLKDLRTALKRVGALGDEERSVSMSEGPDRR